MAPRHRSCCKFCAERSSIAVRAGGHSFSVFSILTMRRLFRLCSLSVLVYIVVFAMVVDRPLSLGVLRLELLQKTARMAALPSPKLVIMAGSNGPYSHSCVVMSVMLNMPCENAGIAVGIGLDDIFVRYE